MTHLETVLVYTKKREKGSARQPLLQLIHINNSRKYQTHLMHLDASLSDAAAFIWPLMVKATKKLKTVANKLSESQI